MAFLHTFGLLLFCLLSLVKYDAISLRFSVITIINYTRKSSAITPLASCDSEIRSNCTEWIVVGINKYMMCMPWSVQASNTGFPILLWLHVQLRKSQITFVKDRWIVRNNYPDLHS